MEKINQVRMYGNTKIRKLAFKLRNIKQNQERYIFKIFKMYVFIYVYYIFIVVQVQLSPFSLHHTHHCLPPSNPHTLALSVCPPYMLLDGPTPIIPHYPSPPPLWLLLVCSSLQCLWLCFACLFVLLTSFHLQVRSYGICPSSPGLFHLA